LVQAYAIDVLAAQPLQKLVDMESGYKLANL